MKQFTLLVGLFITSNFLFGSSFEEDRVPKPEDRCILLKVEEIPPKLEDRFSILFNSVRTSRKVFLSPDLYVIENYEKKNNPTNNIKVYALHFSDFSNEEEIQRLLQVIEVQREIKIALYIKLEISEEIRSKGIEAFDALKEEFIAFTEEHSEKTFSIPLGRIISQITPDIKSVDMSFIDFSDLSSFLNNKAPQDLSINSFDAYSLPRGAGRRMLSFFAYYLRSKYDDRPIFMHLESSSRENYRAYEAMGFEHEEGDRHFSQDLDRYLALCGKRESAIKYYELNFEI